MYSREQTNKLQTTGNQLLKDLKSKPFEKINVDSLRDALRFHEYRYYVLNDPLISDFEYDQLYKALEKIELEKRDWSLQILQHNG